MKNRQYIIFISLIIMSLLIGCAPAVSKAFTEINDALEENQTTVPMDTAIPTIEPSIIPTDLPVPTETSVPTITPIPDLRVVQIGADAALLSLKDVPMEGKYKTAEYWVGRETNEKLVEDYGGDTQQVNEMTGRLDGYWILFFHEGSEQLGPNGILGVSSTYKTVEGPKMFLDSYANCYNPTTGAVIENIGDPIGDSSVACSFVNKDGEKQFEINFIYKNLYLVVSGWDSEDQFEITKEFVVSSANSLIERIAQFPLIESTY
jgi:hypothetical protein